MRPKQQQKARHDDLFRARLDQIINLKHELVILTDRIDWLWLDDELAACFSDEGRPAGAGTLHDRHVNVEEAVIGHCKTDGHLDRNFLKGLLGDQINAVMSSVGYNLRLIPKWLRKLLCKIIAAIWAAMMPGAALKWDS